MSTTPFALKTDQPAIEDSLGFGAYRDALVEIIKTSETPLTIGIFGQWGSGKTSLMQMIKRSLDDEAGSAKHCTIWFNAWKYDREEALWRAFTLRVVDALRCREGPSTQETEKRKGQEQQTFTDLERLEESLYRTVEWQEVGQLTVDWAKALNSTVEGAAEIALAVVPGGKSLIDLLKQVKRGITGDETTALADAFSREVKQHRREQLRSLEQFEGQFSRVVNEYLVENGKRLVVFVDDLDRCLPDKIVEVLEAIKLFLDAQGCVFVLGFDLKAVEDAVQSRYKSPERACLYLEKLIQVPFILPPIEPDQMETFLAELAPDLPKECRQVFAEGLGRNPRVVKRVLNSFFLLWQISQRRTALQKRITQVRLAKVVVIQHNHPDLYILLRETPRYLRDLERLLQTSGETLIELPPALATYAARASLRTLLTLHPPGSKGANFADLTPDDVRTYIYLTYRTPPPHIEHIEVALPFEPEMILIAADRFTMGISRAEAESVARESGKDGQVIYAETPQHDVSLKRYEIGKYPVSNLEYSVFVRETEHKPPSHWEGKDYPKAISDHPVVNVSWEDAIAYCEWLGEKTGWRYRLPTEAEWEYAARGNMQSGYPWGTWDHAKCNTKESGIGGTTPAGQYSPHGDSAKGCTDMAGNVWEWTDDWYKPYPGHTDESYHFGERYKVLRGGSWYHDRDRARCTYRYWQDPKTYGSDLAGFRCVREPKVE